MYRTTHAVLNLKWEKLELKRRKINGEWDETTIGTNVILNFIRLFQWMPQRWFPESTTQCIEAQSSLVERDRPKKMKETEVWGAVEKKIEWMREKERRTEREREKIIEEQIIHLFVSSVMRMEWKYDDCGYIGGMWFQYTTHNII